MKYLITGATGFVAGYLIPLIQQIEPSAQILGVSRQALTLSQAKSVNFTHQCLDLNQLHKLKELISDYHPDFIIHLASDSSVRYSWEEPITSFQNNTNIFLHLLESVRQCHISCRILSVGSSEQYGVVSANDVPLREDHRLNPVSPYAVARVAQEMLSKVYVAGYGLDIVMTRSFNHFGPGQSEKFVLSSFAKQLAMKKIKQDHSSIHVGDLSVIRDFSDVRDVVQAYYLLLQRGHSGEVFNVCSGRGSSLQEILHLMMECCGLSCNIDVSPELLRPVDNPIIIGNDSKIKRDIGWCPVYELEQSIRDLYAFWEDSLVSS